MGVANAPGGNNAASVANGREKDKTALDAERSQGRGPSIADDINRPFVLCETETLTSARRDIKEDKPRRDLYQKEVKSHADELLSLQIEIPERGGFYHDFVCSDGTRLILPETLKHCGAIPSHQQYVCPACGREYSGQKYDRAVRALQHGSLMRGARDLSVVGAMEQNPNYWKKAGEILVKYADAYPGRHTDLKTGGILNHTLDEAVNFIYLAQAYDMIADKGILSENEKEHIRQDLLWECAEGLIETFYMNGGNWRSWHLSSVGVIGFATRHQRYVDFAIKQFKEQISHTLGEDGLWPESVHTYHFYPMRAFIHLAEAAGNCGIDLYNWKAGPHRSLKAMFTQPIYYAYPNLRLPAINDGWYQSFLPLDVYTLGYARLDLPELGWAVKRARRLKTVAKTENPDGVPVWRVLFKKPIEKPKKPAFSSRNFKTLGVAVLRLGKPLEDEVMLTFDHGRFLAHGQHDVMGVTLFAGGRILAADYGTPSYGSQILPYYKGTSSHNTMMIDGKNLHHTKSSSLVAHSFDHPIIQAAVAETNEAADEVNWRRSVFLTKEYALITDELNSVAEHRYDFLFHCEGETLAQHGDSPQSRQVSTSTLGIPYFKHPRLLKESETGIHLWWEDKEKYLLGVVCATYAPMKIFIARCPAETAAREINALIQRQHGTKARFANVLRHEQKTDGITTKWLDEKRLLVSGAGWSDSYQFFDDKIIWQRQQSEKTKQKTIRYGNTPE